MPKYEDDGLDCCRSIVNAILLSLSLWAVILGVSYGAWRSWYTGRLADATVIFGFVGLILVSLSAWFCHQLSEAREDDGSSDVIKVLKPTNTHDELKAQAERTLARCGNGFRRQDQSPPSRSRKDSNQFQMS